MAEKQSKSVEENEEEEKQEEDDKRLEEKQEEDDKKKEKKKKGAVPKKCSKCRVPLKKHIGRWGPKCKNAKPADLHEGQEDEEDEEAEEDEGGEEEDEKGPGEEDSTESSSEDSTETSSEETDSEEEERRRRRRRRKKERKERRRERKERKSHKRKKDTSTPRRKGKKDKNISAISMVAGSIDRSIIDALSEKMDGLVAHIAEMDKKLETERSSASIKEVPTGSSGSIAVREDIQVLAGISDAQKDLLDLGIVVQDTGPSYQRPLPGLRPVAEATEVRHLKPHPGITDRTIRNILQGEYCELPILLPPESEIIKEDT